MYPADMMNCVGEDETWLDVLALMLRCAQTQIILQDDLVRLLHFGLQRVPLFPPQTYIRAIITRIDSNVTSATERVIKLKG